MPRYIEQHRPLCTSTASSGQLVTCTITMVR